MSKLWLQVRRLAPHMRRLLLNTAPNCGAEAVAHLFLQLSARPQRPFLTLSIPEAELRFQNFGQSSHALTSDAFYFVPDVEELSLQAQEGLRRVLHNRRNHSLSLVASTSQDLSTAVSIGTFLPGLLIALAAVCIEVPPLSERTEDLPMILQQMISKQCRIAERTPPRLSPTLLHSAMSHPWADNFRELTEIVEQLLNANSGKAVLNDRDWGRAIQECKRLRPQPEVRMQSLEAVLHEHVYSVLVACKGHKSRAAAVLGISRSSLYRIIEGMRQTTSASLAGLDGISAQTDVKDASAMKNSQVSQS